MAERGKSTVVIGIGNPDRGDDGAGRAVARRLRGALPRGIEVLEHDGEATSLLACLEGREAAYLVDACVSGAAPGTVRRFDASAEPLPRETFDLSSHGLGLAAAVELGRTLGQLPGRCVVYAIEAASFGFGDSLSPAVEAAVAEVGGRLRAELATNPAGGRIDA